MPSNSPSPPSLRMIVEIRASSRCRNPHKIIPSRSAGRCPSACGEHQPPRCCTTANTAYMSAHRALAVKPYRAQKCRIQPRR
jgi:hypothetical protein